MSATKVTLLFNAVTLNSSNQAERSAGFSESYYSTLAIDNPQLKTNWTALCIARANIMPANVSIIGSRYQTVDPVGGSRQYDNKYPPSTTIANDLPGVALQWTVRSPNTPNQRSVILRGIPDSCVVKGEYAPAAGFGPALQVFFNQLRANWQFRAINREVLPVKILTITAGLMTCAANHGLAAGDQVNIMSTFVGTDPGTKSSYTAFVIDVPTARTATIVRTDRAIGADSRGGRVRKVGIIYPSFQITDEEIQSPTAIHRKAGSPFKKFRGRRATSR